MIILQIRQKKESWCSYQWHEAARYPECLSIPVLPVFCLCFLPQTPFPHVFVIPLFILFFHLLVVGGFLVPPSRAVHSCDQWGLVIGCISTLVLQTWVVSPVCLLSRESPLPSCEFLCLTLWVTDLLSPSVEFLYSTCLRRWATGLSSRDASLGCRAMGLAPWSVFSGQRIDCYPIMAPVVCIWVLILILLWQNELSFMVVLFNLRFKVELCVAGVFSFQEPHCAVILMRQSARHLFAVPWIPFLWMGSFYHTGSLLKGKRPFE